MSLTAEEAVSRVRESLSAPETQDGDAYLVKRLDRIGAAYYIVLLGHHIACIDAASGELLLSAEVDNPVSLLPVDDAKAFAEFEAGAGAELVWKPCAASQSMFYPIWAVSNEAETKYVDQGGGVWPELEPKRPGGG
jgi:hypothetical protein